jgi:hypothetical protein
MVEVLQFIFSSFWIWMGSVILVSAITSAVVSVVGVLFKR